MGKRKNDGGKEDAVTTPLRRSTRQKVSQDTDANDQPQRPAPEQKKPVKKLSKKDLKAIKDSSEIDSSETAKPKTQNKTNVNAKSESADADSNAAPVKNPSGRQYWLMKAEPETRLENGHDVRFSIDDLATKNEPEPWDGIRAYAARNNLRAMKKGDLAFFYHSNCKVPSVVGIMEIVREHSPDLSAHDPNKPYYDASSKPGDPKWSVVHVEFRQKFESQITLKEMKDWQKEDGHPLKDMQMLKLSRMSVSKVSVSEWEFLTGELRKRGEVISL